MSDKINYKFGSAYVRYVRIREKETQKHINTATDLY